MLKECRSAQDILGQHELVKQLTQRLIDRALEGELTAQLGYERHDKGEGLRENSRNGRCGKSRQTDTGTLTMAVPRDRTGQFEPQLIKKHQRRLSGFDDVVLSLYARGLPTREIQGHLKQRYGTEVLPGLISQVTETVLEDVKAWQFRPLERVYPILYLDAWGAKSREAGPVGNNAVYLALGINLQGQKELLGLWMVPTEGQNSKTRITFTACFRDEAIRKVVYLALQNVSKKWTQPVANWAVALNQFSIPFGDRIPQGANS